MVKTNIKNREVGKVKLLQGDCLELMINIPDKSVDLILCDLPYGTTACSWDEIIPLNKLWEQYKRIIRPNGFMVFTASQPFSSKLTMSNINNFSHQWIWKKNTLGNPLLANMMPMKNFEDVIVFYNDYKADIYLEHPLREYSKKIMDYINRNIKQINSDLGHRRAEHFFYVKSTQYDLCTEIIYNQLLRFYNLGGLDFILPYQNLKKIHDEFYSQYPRRYNPQKTKGKPYKLKQGSLGEAFGGTRKENIVTENNGDRFPTSIIEFNTDKDKLHPTQKPVALMEYLIKTYTNEGDLVLDNCMGSGTTGVACVNLNREFIGMELDEKYFEIAKERIIKLNSEKVKTCATKHVIPPKSKDSGILPNST